MKLRGIAAGASALVMIAAGIFLRASDSAPGSRANAIVADCRRQLLDAARPGRSAEWKPGKNRIGIRTDGIWFTTVELRARTGNGRTIGFKADCEYEVSADTTYVRARTTYQQVNLNEHDETAADSLSLTPRFPE